MHILLCFEQLCIQSLPLLWIMETRPPSCGPRLLWLASNRGDLSLIRRGTRRIHGSQGQTGPAVEDAWNVGQGLGSVLANAAREAWVPARKGGLAHIKGSAAQGNMVATQDDGEMRLMCMLGTIRAFALALSYLTLPYLTSPHFNVAWAGRSAQPHPQRQLDKTSRKPQAFGREQIGTQAPTHPPRGFL